jgi:hypothetical protein
MGRKLRNFALFFVINAAAGVFAVVAFFAYGKLTYEGYFCGRFARVDGEIGWVLAPNATSCIGGRAPFSAGPPWFESKVHTDVNGFRSAKAGAETARNGVLFAGDSWTFGFGVNFEDSFPGQFQARSGAPAVVAASPAYGSAQALLLTERWIGQLTPRAIVYLDLGFWDRSACRGAVRPTAILKPCYWQPPEAQSAELVLPPRGTVERFASWGLMPGGMLGAGEDTWTYFIWSRPVAQFQQVLVRLGLISGFGHDFRAVGVDETAIQRGVFDHIARIAARARVPVLVLDPANIYAAPYAALAPEQRIHLHHVGSEQWHKSVGEPASKLPAELARVPHDGHFGPGLNALVAELIQERLAALRVTP